MTFQQKTEAKKKHDFVCTGNLAYIFESKHLTFRTMLRHLEREENRGKGGLEGNGLAGLELSGGNNTKGERISLTSMEGGVGSSRGADSLFGGAS